MHLLNVYVKSHYYIPILLMIPISAIILKENRNKKLKLKKTFCIIR